MAHPYYPPSLVLSYAPPAFTPLVLISVLGGLSILALALAWQLMSIVNPSLTARSKATASWFLYCGLLHIHFEGYFIKYRRTLVARTDIVGELWKEYALADSRYLLNGKAEGEFVLAIEALTVILLGPLCLLTFLAIVLESPKRHPARLLACCCHIYGVLLYFVTAAVGGKKHCRPGFLYFWIYFVGCNIPWLVVPAVLGWRSFKVMTEAVELQEAGMGIRKLKLR